MQELNVTYQNFARRLVRRKQNHGRRAKRVLPNVEGTNREVGSLSRGKWQKLCHYF